jgi:hypothetical protein
MPTWKFRLVTDEEGGPAVAYSFPDGHTATPAEIAELMRNTVARIISGPAAAEAAEGARMHRERADAVERGDLALVREPYSEA